MLNEPNSVEKWVEIIKKKYSKFLIFRYLLKWLPYNCWVSISAFHFLLSVYFAKQPLWARIHRRCLQNADIVNSRFRFCWNVPLLRMFGILSKAAKLHAIPLIIFPLWLFRVILQNNATSIAIPQFHHWVEIFSSF